MAFSLTIITPAGKQFDEEISSVIAPGVEGYFGILSKHAPIVAALGEGVVEIKGENGQNFFAIPYGILDVDINSRCLILSNQVLQAASKEEAKELVKNFKQAALAT